MARPATEHWCKVSAQLDSNPKIRRAGRNGREVFMFALRRNALPSNPLPGSISADELDPEYLADQLQMPIEDARNGVTAAVTSRLLRQCEDRFELVGWEDEWGKVVSTRPMTTGERQERFREKQRRLKGLQQGVTKSNDEVTEHVTDVVTSNASNGRGEERREEEEEDPAPRARAIPPSTEPEVVAVRGEMQPRERGRLAESTYARLSAARVEEGRRLGIPNVLAFPEVHPGRHPASFADLQLRIREEGINAARHCEVVIANLIAQCRETNSIEWLAEKSFTVGGWRTARNWQPGQQRAGPRFASREPKPEPPPVKVPTYR